MKAQAKRTSQISESGYLALASFRHALRNFLHFSADAARAAGLSAPQHQALLAIKGLSTREQVSIGRLAERLFLRHHSTVEMVDRLVKKRLLKRSPSKEDRRKVLVSLTVQGEALIKRLSAAHLDELRRIGPELRRWLEMLN